MRVVSPDKTSLSETRVARCGMSLRDLDVQWMCQRASAGSRRNRPRYPNRIWDTIGRSERIRTSDPRLPKTVLYQAELHSGNSVAILSAGALQPWSQVRRALVIAMVWGQGKRLDNRAWKWHDSGGDWDRETKRNWEFDKLGGLQDTEGCSWTYFLIDPSNRGL